MASIPSGPLRAEPTRLRPPADLDLRALAKLPSLVFADETGQPRVAPEYVALGVSGDRLLTLPADELIELPFGSNLYHLPGRAPVAIERRTGKLVTLRTYRGRRCTALGTHMAPAHTMTLGAAYHVEPAAPTLPLFAYAAIGLDAAGRYVVPAVRVDPDIRQDCEQFDATHVSLGAADLRSRYPDNRLVEHLVGTCALTYSCPAARNFTLGRWEAPIPTSPGCNADCVGCISFQPEDAGIVSTQDRLTFSPTAEEIAEFAVEHLRTAPRPIVSFGQGCEGEPLLQGALIERAIRLIRSQTDRGVVNINTNGSRPEVVQRLVDAGLDSIRVSLNSLREPVYAAYYRPRNYRFADVLTSAAVVRRAGGWASINYLSFPGITDQPAEVEALRAFIERTDLSMIQWRNLNIDPDLYRDLLGHIERSADGIGMARHLRELRADFPALRYGYFNPPREVMADAIPA